MAVLSFDILNSIAASVGLSVVAVADVDDLIEDQGYLRRWQEAELSGDMSFMRRDPSLLSSPTKLMNGVKSIVVFGVYYDRSERKPLRQGYGRVARYAWGKDYHKVLRKRLSALCDQVSAYVGAKIVSRVFSDSVPLLERAIARRAGLGFVGKNSMLILPRSGSFFFLGEILWDLEISSLPNPESIINDSSAIGRCGECSRCIDRCPTGAFVSERVLDARKCISYLTIEKRGALTLQERQWLGEWLFGCDVCQEVCPFNVISLKAKKGPDLPEFGAQYGAGQMLSLSEVLDIRSDSDFIARFGGTAIMRTKREGLLRNAAIVAANTEAVMVLAALRRAATDDLSPVVRQHALWSYVSLSLNCGANKIAEAKELLMRCSKDPDAGVRAEAMQCMV